MTVDQIVDAYEEELKNRDFFSDSQRAYVDDVGTATLFIRYEKENHKEVKKDLDLLFGGEDESRN